MCPKQSEKKCLTFSARSAIIVFVGQLGRRVGYAASHVCEPGSYANGCLFMALRRFPVYLQNRGAECVVVCERRGYPGQSASIRPHTRRGFSGDPTKPDVGSATCPVHSDTSTASSGCIKVTRRPQIAVWMLLAATYSREVSLAGWDYDPRGLRQTESLSG